MATHVARDRDERCEAVAPATTEPLTHKRVKT